MSITRISYLLNMGLITKNIAENLRTPKRDHKEVTTWDEKNINQFIQSVKNDRLFALFFYQLAPERRITRIKMV